MTVKILQHCYGFTKDIFNNKWYRCFLYIIIFLSIFIIYSYDLANPLSGLYCDEAAIGYNAYSISYNLRDENNHLLPLQIANMGGLKNPVYIYLTAIIIKVLGLSVYSTRILAVLSAVFSILFLFLITRRLFDTFTAFTAAYLLTFTQGFFHLFRIAFELVTFSCFILGAIYFFIIGYDKKSFKYCIPGIICFILAWYSYVPAKVFLVSFLIILALFYIFQWKAIIINMFQNHKRTLLVAIVLISFLILLPEGLTLNTLTSSYHFNNRFLFLQSNDVINSSSVILQLKTFIPDIQNWSYFPRVILASLTQYLNSYSYGFLFTEGDNCIRHHIASSGPFPLISLLLIPVGLIVTLRHIREFRYRAVLSAFIAKGIPSAMIIIPVQITNNSQMFIIFSLLSAIGLVGIVNTMLKLHKNKIAWGIYLISFLIVFYSFCSYLNVYFGDYRIYSQNDWQVNRSKIVKYIADNYKSYDNIYFSPQITDIYIHILFYGSIYSNFKPDQYQRHYAFPFNAKLLLQSLYYKNIQIDSIIDFYGNNSLILLNHNELPDYKPTHAVKIFYFYPDNIDSLFMKF